MIRTRNGARHRPDVSDALAPMLADSIIVIGVDGLGDKAAIDQAESAEPATDPYMPGDFKVEFLSDDVAVMAHSTPPPEPHWSMHVWQKIDGEWRVTATAKRSCRGGMNEVR